VAQSNELAQSLLQGLPERLRSAIGMIVSLATEDVGGRVVRALLEYAEIEERRLAGAGPLTQQDDAKMVGASRGMVNRSLQELVRGGLIEREEGRILLPGLAASIG